MGINKVANRIIQNQILLKMFQFVKKSNLNFNYFTRIKCKNIESRTTMKHLNRLNSTLKCCAIAAYPYKDIFQTIFSVFYKTPLIMQPLDIVIFKLNPLH